VARLTQSGAPTCRARDASNTTSDAHSASPEITDSNDGRAVSSMIEPTNALALSCSTSSLRMTTSLLTTAGHRRNGGAELPPPPRRYALSKPGHLPSSICHTMLSSTRASPGRERLWKVTSGRLSALSASDRHRRGWSTKSAWRRRCGCLRRRLTPNWGGGTERSSGQQPESARGGRRGYRKQAAR
jgi:hypothetical protein